MSPLNGIERGLEHRGDVRAFTYHEMRWFKTRYTTLLGNLRDLYGQSLPILIRRRHHRGDGRWGAALRIFQLDQIATSLCREHRLKVFTWGDKLEGYNKYVARMSQGAKDSR